jgi:type VI secretion system ImpM family protein
MSRTAGALKFDHFGCFGKLPLSREFIVEGSRDLAASGFEPWIGEGIGLAKARLGGRYNDLVRTFPHYRFCWGFSGDAVLSGVIRPSQDGAGRKHPISMFSLLRGNVDSAVDLALQVANLQGQSHDLLVAAEAAETPAALRDLVQSTPPALDTSVVIERYEKFLAETTARHFWDSLAGDNGDETAFVILQVLIETITPLRNGDARAFRGGIRFPLSEGEGTDFDLATAFWLAVTERLLGKPLGNAWWLRSAGSEGEAMRYLFLFLSPPTPNHWLGLLDQGSELESISYLDRPYGSVSARERMNPQLRALLENDSTTLDDLLRFDFSSL